VRKRVHRHRINFARDRDSRIETGSRMNTPRERPNTGGGQGSSWQSSGSLVLPIPSSVTLGFLSAPAPKLRNRTQRASGDPELNSRKKADSLENDSPGLPKRFAKVTMNCQAGHRRIRGFFSGPTRDDAWPKDLVPRNGLLRYTFL